MRAIAVGVLALLAGCDGCLAPKPVCYPKTCADLHRNCGPAGDDGCGQMLDCGGCPFGQSCGILLPNVCDATPDSGSGWMGGGAPAGGGSGIGGGAVAGGGAGGAGPGGGVGGAGGGPDAGLSPPVLVLAGTYSDHVDLTWSVPSGAFGFAMDRSFGMGPFQQIGLDPGLGNVFSDFGVMPGTHVAYEVFSIDPTLSRGPPSNQVAVTVPLAVNAWRTAGADIQHSSANLLESARPPGVLAWERVFDGGSVTGVAVDPPRAFAGVWPPGGMSASLVAFGPDGGTLWSAPLGPIGGISHPSVFDGEVLINYTRPMQGEVDAFDESGTPLWQVGSQSFHPGPMPAPISTGDTVLANIAATGMLVAIDQNTGASKSATILSPADPWTPTLSAGHLWVPQGPMVSTIDLVTFSTNSSFPTFPTMGISDEWVAGSSGLTVVAAAAALFGNNAFQQLWMQPASRPYVAPPAIAASPMVPATIFVANSDEIEMRDLMSGNLVGSFATDGGLSYPPAYAAGVIYASSLTTVFAFDVQTHQLLWTTTPGGRLSIAQGTLYVAGGDTVRAYTLTP